MKKKIKLIIQSEEDRNAMVIALANGGYPVTTDSDFHGTGTDYYVEFEIDERDVKDKPID